MKKHVLGLALVALMPFCAAQTNAQQLTIKTQKATGDKLEIRLKANGDVTVKGAKGTFVNGEKCSFKLEGQEVTFEGDITFVSCNENELTAIDVTTLPNLTQLTCYNNNLTTLDVSKNPELANLQFPQNSVKTIDVSKNTKLKKLFCGTNVIESLDVTANKELQELWCQNNRITTLDVKNNTKLTYLACNYNPIASLDVSTLVNLSTLYCYGMKLDVLDVTRNTKLVSLWCNSNNLKKLDISQNKMLEDVSIDQNMIRDNEMTAIVEALPDMSEAEYPGFFYVYNEEKENGNVCTTEQVKTAKAKNWGVKWYNPSSADWEEYSGSEPTSIAGNCLTAQLGTAVIYDIQGNRLNDTRHGLNIIRRSDGKTVKVMK